MVVVEEFLRLNFPGYYSVTFATCISATWTYPTFCKVLRFLPGVPKGYLIVLSCLLPKDIFPSAPALCLIGHPRFTRCCSPQVHLILLIAGPLPLMQQSFRHKASQCLWHCWRYYTSLSTIPLLASGILVLLVPQRLIVFWKHIYGVSM